jgi:hypothetical protein
MASKKLVVFKPISKSLENPDVEVRSVSIGEIFSFDLSGVSYKGFFRKKISETEYKLIPQEKAFFRGGTSVVGDDFIIISLDANKKFFCTSIIISYYQTTRFSSQIFFQDANSKTKLQIYAKKDEEIKQFFFKEPIEFPASQIYIGFEEIVAGERIYFDLFGFYEPI